MFYDEFVGSVGFDDDNGVFYCEVMFMSKISQGFALLLFEIAVLAIPAFILTFILLAWDEVKDEYGGYADKLLSIPEVDCWMGAVNACSDVVVWIIGMGVVVYAFFRFFRFIWNIGGNAR